MRLKVPSDGRRDIWHSSASCPYDSSRVPTKLRQHVDGVKDISLTYVSKYATDQYDVSRHRSRIRRQQRSIPCDNLDLAKVRLVRPLASFRDISLVELNQASFNAMGMRIRCQNLYNVASLASANTYHLERTIQFRWKGVPELRLDNRQAPLERRVILVITAMPLMPIFR